MPLELRVMLVDSVTGVSGYGKSALAEDAALLTPTSFSQQYVIPAVAHAWLKLAEAVEARAKHDTDRILSAPVAAD